MNMRRALKAVWSRLKSAEDVVEDGGLALVDARSLPEHVRIAAIALVVGMLAGGAAILFRLVLEGVQFGFFGFSHGSILELARSLPWWHVMLAPALGGLAIGWFIRVLAYERRTHGVPDVIIASLLERGKLPPKAAVGAALVSAASAGVGASVGREGPLVHLGASVGSWVGQRLRLSNYDTKTLLGCGVAAGIAASFNVPVAGTIFAFEVVLKRYSFQRLAPVVIAAVTGTVVSRLYYGDFPAWHVPERIFVSYWEFPAFAVLGLVCAAAAFLLMRCVGLTGHLMDRSQIPRVMRPAVAGLGVGAIAVFFPEVLGVGYEAADAALRESLPLAIWVAVVAAKIVATGLSLGSGFGSGFGGGIFSPSLVVGAMTGGAFGIVATAAMPELSSGHGAYTIVGMAAVAGAVLGAPFQAILIIFEMTTSYSLALAVMLATVISAILVNDVLRIDFFGWQVKQRGIDLKAAIPQAVLGDVSVRPLVRRDVPRVSTNAGYQAIADAFVAAPIPELLVVDTDGRLVGRLVYRDFAVKAGANPSTLEALTADAIATPQAQVLEASDDASTAWLLFADNNTDRLPVVEDRVSARLIGYLDRQDLLTAYQRVLTKTL